MSIFNNGIRKGCVEGDLPANFERIGDEEDTPSCECCGGPLHTANEVFSEECNECFSKFLKVTIDSIHEQEH